MAKGVIIRLHNMADGVADGLDIPFNVANESESPGSSEDHHEDGEFSNPVSR